jgi:chromatin remodeling complex protein RSC6
MGKKVVETVSAPVAAAPVMQKESKKTSKKAEVAPVEAAPAPVEAAPAPVEAPVAAPVEAAPAQETQTAAAQVHELLTSARENAHQLSELARQQENRIRQLEKMVAKLEKEAGKRKRRANSGAKKGETPKGFNKKYQVSDSLCSFLGMDKGSQMTRLEIVGRVRQYANDNNLKDPKNGRVIIPDAKLTKLFNVPKDQQLTIFNIQRYITPHVTPVEAAAPAPVAAAPVTEKKSKKSN